MPVDAQPLERSAQITGRYHLVGAHGAARIYQVTPQRGETRVSPP